MATIDMPPRLAVRPEPKLTGVPETMLWPLWNRAAEARRPDPLIDDPWSIALVDRLDYDFRRSFGKPNVMHAIRARVCDDLIRDYAAARPGGPATVIALGEGLDSQRLRVGSDGLAWFSVDVPEALALRGMLLEGATDRERFIRCSALDEQWIQDTEHLDSPLITALGLFMYFEPDDVRGLLRRIARRFEGAEIFFDTIPPFFSRKTLRGLKVTPHYTAPPMPWGISVDDIAAFLRPLGWKAVSVQTYADPFPQRTRLYSFLSNFAYLRSKLAGCLVHARTR